MKSLKTGLLSWKTTIVGAVLAALLVLQDSLQGGVRWGDPALWVAVAIAALGFLSKDSDRGALPLVGLLACLTLPSCETMRVRGTLGYIDPETGAKAGMSITDEGGGWWIKVPLPSKDDGTSGGVMVVEGDIPKVDQKSGK
jgi:hypothetical protein